VYGVLSVGVGGNDNVEDSVYDGGKAMIDLATQAKTNIFVNVVPSSATWKNLLTSMYIFNMLIQPPG